MLSQEFYRRGDVVKIARELLGKYLVTNVQGVTTGGIIVETEAYSWKERGCHAYGGRKTARNEIMFSEGGVAYVYLCYGVHHLFNVVTNREGLADAVLIRALEPTFGVDVMHQRRGELKNPFHLTSGPGKLTKALHIDRSLNGFSLLEQTIRIETNGLSINQKNINVSQRIGIDYAGADANLPWRFSVKDNPWVSRGG